MTPKKYLDENGLLYYNQKLKSLINSKVDKVENMGLSTNDLTDALLGLINAPDYTTIVNKPTLDGTTITGTLTKAGLGIAAANQIPTNNNQLTNGAGYQTSSQVQTAINSALSGITSIDFQIVATLPTQGVKGIIYLVANSGGSYDEYIWLTDLSAYEKIGSTDVDLTDYVTFNDLAAITNAEIDTIMAS
ncbi:MAG: hypothetical protein ACOX05_05730 [Bacillota bacterium]|jgi:hypothetical protein